MKTIPGLFNALNRLCMRSNYLCALENGNPNSQKLNHNTASVLID